ncbi:MAG: energy transducer TonB [Puniceicoccaceae bacterium]
MRRGNSLRCLARLLIAGLIFLILSTGGQSATSAGNADGPEIIDPVLLWPLHINIPYTIVHLVDADATATVILRIDESGSVIDWVALDLPHYDLIRPLDRAFQSARFQPAMMDGEAVLIDIVVDVPVGEVGYYGIINLDPATYLEIKLNRMSGGLYGLRVAPGHALDEPLKLISEGKPVVFIDEAGNRVSGEQEVEFYIDQDGIPRVVRSDQEDDPFLRDAAHQTVEQFRFAPPRCNGRPTVVKARIKVQF